MTRFFFPILLLTANQSDAPQWVDSPEVEAVFRDAGVSGAFVVYDVHADRLVGYNKTRANTRFVPASTFKIPHSLIGLSVGAVQNVDDVLPYKGPKEPFVKGWDKDMGLREAIAISNVPIYQELARRIGLERMTECVARLNYGNNTIGAVVDEFWLTGPLAISAVEQVRFLADLAQGKLPYSAQHQKIVREITVTGRGGNWTLHGKTGWENAPGPGVGWWVGWVEGERHIHPFALNIDIQAEGDAATRIPLGRACLTALGILPREEGASGR